SYAFTTIRNLFVSFLRRQRAALNYHRSKPVQTDRGETSPEEVAEGHEYWERMMQACEEDPRFAPIVNAMIDDVSAGNGELFKGKWAEIGRHINELANINFGDPLLIGEKRLVALAKETIKRFLLRIEPGYRSISDLADRPRRNAT